MHAALSRLPLIVLLAGLSGLAMLGPAIIALRADEHYSARAFFYSGLLVLIVVAMLAVVTRDRPVRHLVRSQLLSLLAAFLLLPALLALPLFESMRDTSFTNAYFEMVSAITTTGASVYSSGGRLSAAEELWRAMVAWGGGLIMWSAAVALFAPMGLGGYEVALKKGPAVGLAVQKGQLRTATERMLSAAYALLPIYGGLTLCLFISLLIAGDRTLVAAIHAMCTLATAGFSPIGGVENSASGRAGEVIVACFLIFALSRRTFSQGVLGESTRDIREDPELRLALTIIVFAAAALFMRHFMAAVQIDEVGGVLAGLRALWGTAFTALSFLTTTGFASADWVTARSWSGIEAPGLLLMGLALIGGGVATTAGGVKLLRVYSLLKHGEREIGRLVFPSSVGGAGRFARHVRREGAFISWIVFMLLAVSIAGIMLALSAAGVSFEDALILSTASLSNTGPLAQYAAADPIQIAALETPAKYVMALAMVIGRLETLVIVALLNPAFWRS